MDIANWIEKNNYKNISDDLSDQIDKLESLKFDKEKLANKIKYYKTTIKSLKERLNVVNNEIKKTNKSYQIFLFRKWIKT